MPQSTPHKALIAIAILAGGALLAPSSAEARRFGGGHSTGMSRSISTHSTTPSHITHHTPSVHSLSPTDRPPYPIEYAPLTPSAGAHDSSPWPGASSAALARARLEAAHLEAARNRRASRHRNETDAQADSYAGTAIPMETTHASRSVTMPLEVTSRPADPRFAKLTDRAPQPSSACEYKPVMSDADYIACGATPPQFPLAR